MGFRRFELSEVQNDYRQLYKKAQRSVIPFGGFDYLNKKLFAGDFLVLKNRCDIKVYGWYRAGHPKILVTHYVAKEPGLTHASSIGAILVDPSTAPSEIVSFQGCLKEELKAYQGQTVAPLNGHAGLGYALPSPQVASKEIGFQASSQSLLLQSFFAEGEEFKVAKQIPMHVDEILTRDSLPDIELPKYLSVRSVSQLRFKRDVEIYNQLLNKCMMNDPTFFPLKSDEQWEVMKHSWPLIVPEYFQFLLYNGVEVGFCFALPDYNVLFENGSDIRNALLAVANRRAIPRARIIRAGILPHFDGRGWLKMLKSKVAHKMAHNGVREIGNLKSDFVGAKNQSRRQDYLLYNM